MKIRIKKTVGIITLFVILFLNVVSASAQPQGNGGKRPQGPPPVPNDMQISKMVDDLSTELSLTPDQENKVSALYFDHFKAEKKSTEQKGSAGESQKKEMEKQSKKLDKKVKAILTKEQKKMYIAYKKNNPPRQGGPVKR